MNWPVTKTLSPFVIQKSHHRRRRSRDILNGMYALEKAAKIPVLVAVGVIYIGDILAAARTTLLPGSFARRTVLLLDTKYRKYNRNSPAGNVDLIGSDLPVIPTSDGKIGLP